jgi:hypothetical protein
MLGRQATISLARVLARIRSGQGLAYVLGVLLALLTLVPLAHASPPDPVWLAGMYDDADLDEAVVAVVSITGLVVGVSVASVKPGTVAAGAASGLDTPSFVVRPLSTFRNRAPPA